MTSSKCTRKDSEQPAISHSWITAFIDKYRPSAFILVDRAFITSLLRSEVYISLFWVHVT